MSTLLTINNISCGYGNGFHIKDISFSLSEGSFTGIIGPNGSGKTTLFKGISGDLSLNSGSVFFDEKDKIV